MARLPDHSKSSSGGSDANNSAAQPLLGGKVGSPKEDGSSQQHRFTMCGLSAVITAIVASLSWMGVSSGLIMLNKNLLSTGFPYPMALSGTGVAFSALASYITCHHLKLVEAKRHITLKFYMTRIMPVGLCMALTLGFGNLVYMYLTVSFIQILKSFTPVMTMLALFLAKLETPTARLIVSVCLIAAGTALASVGEVNFSTIGIMVMFASESFEAIRLVMTQQLLTGLSFHPIEGLMYLAPAGAFWLFLGSLLFELPRMIANDAFSFVASHPLKFASAAMMGFAVNSLGYIVIKSASSLTLKVLGTVKNAFVVWCGIFFLQETVTKLQGFGYGIAIIAFYWYQKLKMEQIRGDAPTSGRGDGQAILPVAAVPTESTLEASRGTPGRSGRES